MAAFEEWIVRDYFESQGFLLRGCGDIPGKRKEPAFRAWLISRPDAAAAAQPDAFMLFGSHLAQLCSGCVILPLTEPSRPPRTSAEIARFVERHITPLLGKALQYRASEPSIGQQQPLLMVLPGFPTAEPHRGQLITSLRSAGVTAVLSFRSMLLQVVEQLTPGASGDAIRDTMVALKRHDLLKDSQMILFERS
jgi:hypothetical protein